MHKICLRDFFGKIRRKIIKALLGRELINDTAAISKLDARITQLNEMGIDLQNIMNTNLEYINKALFRVENGLTRKQIPKVSIVMPIYNVAKYLREALDSVTRQTLKDIEIICVNDGSTDNSLDIVKEYSAKDERIIVIDKPNRGYGHTMNVGIDMATGEYLGILETDDFASLTMFEDLYKIAVENDLDVARGDFYKFTRDEKKNMNLEYISFCHKPSWYNKVFNLSIEVESSKIVINIWNGIYRMAFLKNNNIRFHESPGASFQDNGFFWQVQVYAQRAMYIKQPYYYCRRDNPNSSVKDPTKVWSMSREYDFIRSVLVKNDDIWHRYKNYFWLRRYNNYNFTENLIAPEFKREFILYISKEYKNALETGELSPKLFSNDRWSRVQWIIDNPEDYIQKRYEEMPQI